MLWHLAYFRSNHFKISLLIMLRSLGVLEHSFQVRAGNVSFCFFWNASISEPGDGTTGFYKRHTRSKEQSRRAEPLNNVFHTLVCC